MLGLCDDDLVGIGVDDEIGVMRDHDHLPGALRLDK